MPSFSTRRSCSITPPTTARDGSRWSAACFTRRNYGIVFPTNSPLRKQVNEALLALREDGTYEDIYNKWFGKK